MDALAAWLGTLLGAALKECAPVLKDIVRDAIRDAINPKMEDGKPDDELRQRLIKKINEVNRR
jgi:hypothetical protein